MNTDNQELVRGIFPGISQETAAHITRHGAQGLHRL